MLEKRSSEGVSVGNDGTAPSSKSQLQCCLFCYRNCDDVNSKNYSICATKTSNGNVSTTNSMLNPSQPLLKKFLMLFQRCLIDNKRSGTQSCLLPLPFENHFERPGTCQDCSILLQEFCNLYDQIKCLELKLSWRLKGLQDIMKSADKVPSRLKAFRNQIVTNELEENEQWDETLIEIKKFRNSLMDKCSAKIQSSYPKIQLKRCNSEVQCTGNERNKNKRTKIEVVEPETPGTINLENEPPSETVSIDLTSVFPVHVKVQPLEYEYWDSNCVANIGEGDDVPLPSPKPTPTERLEVDEDLAVAVPCTSSTIHSKKNQNEEVCETKKCDQNQIATTNIPSKMTKQLKEIVMVNRNTRRHSKRLLNHDAKAIESQCPNNEAVEAMSNTFEQGDIDQNGTINSSLPSPVGQDSDNDDEFVPDNDDDADYTPEVDADQLDDDDDISIEESNDTLLVNKVEEESTEVHREKDPTTSSTKLNAKGKTGLMSLKQLAMNSVLDLPLKLLCKIYPCSNTSFLSSKELANHSKWHDKFKCNFCETMFSYAPTLVKHEINEHKRKGEEGSGNCARCNLNVGGDKFSILTHYLKSHLGLPLVRRTCPICGELLRRDVTLRKVFLQHFNSKHNITGVALSVVNKCDENKNQANFRATHRTPYEKCICEDCGMELENRLDLEHHLSHHVVPTEFKIPCTFPNCKKMFETKASMEYHKRRLHESGNRSCSQSSKSMISTTPERQMKPYYKTAKMHGCKRPECKRKFYSVSDLEIHSRLHGNFKCQFCKKIFTFAPELPVHEIKCVEEGKGEKLENSVCTRCFCKVTDEKTFISHFVETHLELEMDRHTCLICGAHSSAFDFKRFREHFIRHHDLRKVGPDGKTYECDMEGCSAYFLTLKQMRWHKKSHVTAGKFKIRDEFEDGKKYECSDCGQRFQWILKVRKHIERVHHHMRLKPFRCISSRCTFRFDTQALLDDHIAQTGLVKCPHCEQLLHGGHGLSSFKTHVMNCPQNKEAGNCKKKPSGTKPAQRKWQCEECGKSFKSKERMSIHRLVHSGPASWEYMCSICSKKCMRKGKLDEHMLSHSNEKPFICEICGVKYKHRHNLRIHVNSKHGDIAYDKPRNFDKTNLTSRKGIKLKNNDGTKTRESRRNGSKQKRKMKYEPSSDSSISE